MREGRYEEFAPVEAMPVRADKETSGFIPRKLVGRTENQVNYIQAALANDITLCHGPAGSGKTHIAVALAVRALREKKIERIVLTRPAVDSGKSIGFLPGTLEEKMAPYLRPLFDELAYYINREHIKAWMEHDIIEIAPMSYIRGRTFVNSYVIVDEAQNAELKELKMCLTRIGPGSKMMLVGDLFQSDLHHDLRGGFKTCIEKLTDIEGIAVVGLKRQDIIRHHLIGQIEERLP